ncbi:substrate-binding domain-containing protein [Thiosocius teredinicola]|uniref:substrate-binding domain-containing protein n=1 Tax=Thiosocius teredinicola TaxID=1973002 RepID=UPI002FE4A8A2
MRTKCVSLFQLYLIGALAVLLSGFTWAAPETSTIRLATTTSTENSGLLDELLPKFKQATGYDVHVIAVGTGKALRMGSDGDVDVVLVHAPAAEQKFVDEGNGEQRLPVMFNDFVLVGPASDPAGIASAKTAAEALGKIADTQTVFVSRGDDSGTHKKERSLWTSASIQPDGQWYREAGQGMGKVLQMANELEAYTLADRGTWLAYRDKSSLRVLFQGDEKLFNPYAIIEVSRQKFPDLNHQGAQALIDWIRGPQGQQAIAAFRKAGEQLFTPSAGTLARR